MAWTSITSDTSWQDLSVANEIATAYNKRAAVVGEDKLETRLGVTSIGTGVSVYSFVRSCQTGIQALALKFADPDATLTGLSASPAKYASVSAMMTDAGLTKSGYWRRIADDGSNPNPWTSYSATGWSYGLITSKDLAGPWLFKDIQTALTKLTRIIKPISPSSPTQDHPDTYYESSFNVYATPGPSLPPGVPQDYLPDWFEGYNFWSRLAHRDVFDDYSTFQFNESAAYSKTITGLTDESKTAKLIAVTDGAYNTNFYDWGYGWTAGKTAVIASFASTTAKSINYESSIPIAKSFGELYAGVGDGTGAYGSTAKFNLTSPVLVVDYSFDP